MELLKLLRIPHWIKNGFVFVPAFFGQVIRNEHIYWHLLALFFAFSFLASSIYIINDIGDRENDRKHPEKCKRPIAAGTVSVKTGIITSIILMLIALGGTLALSLNAFLILAGYFVLNIAYTYFLKKIPIIDLMTIAAGFELRVFAGAVIAMVPVSEWLIIMTGLLALFLASSKRRSDLIIKRDTGVEMRRSIRGYSLKWFDPMIVFLSAGIVAAYIFYTISPEVLVRTQTKLVALSGIFVAAGIARYLYLTFTKNPSSPVKTVMRDWIIIVSLLSWIGTYVYWLY